MHPDAAKQSVIPKRLYFLNTEHEYFVGGLLALKRKCTLFLLPLKSHFPEPRLCAELGFVLGNKDLFP